MIFSFIASSKLGHPVPELNFASEWNNGVSHILQVYIPSSFIFKRSPEKGISVPLLINTWYSFAERFHHRIVPVKPALVQLKTDGKFLQDWSGVRASCCVSLYEDGEFVKMEEGEIQLTDYGVSGICIFNLSRYVSLGIPSKKESLKISFLPFLKDKTKEEIFSWLDQRGEKLKDSSMVEFLEGCLPYKLISVLLDCAHISKRATWKQLSSLEKERFYSTVFSFSLLFFK